MRVQRQELVGFVDMAGCGIVLVSINKRYVNMSYQDALSAAGCNIIEFMQFGSYQGDWYAYVELDGEKGVISGSYGSCSGCDAFEAEFGWDDDEKSDYQERLKAFGETYLPILPVAHYIEGMEKRVNDGFDWGEEKECLEWLKSINE